MRHIYSMSKLEKQLYPSHLCLRRYYDKNLDTAIGRALYENEPQGYRQLRRTIESDQYLSRCLSSDVYYHHIKTLREVNLLTAISNNCDKGEKLDMCLTDTGRELVRLGIFEVDSRPQPRREILYVQKTEQEKLRKAYQILLVLLSTDYLSWRNEEEGI